MNQKLVAAMLVVLASCGCCTCDCSCDYLPPVLDGPYSSPTVRSGSATAMPANNEMNDEMNNDINAIEPFAGKAITPLSVPE